MLGAHARAARHVPGAYAMVVNEDVPHGLREILEDRGIRLPPAQAG